MGHLPCLIMQCFNGCRLPDTESITTATDTVASPQSQTMLSTTSSFSKRMRDRYAEPLSSTSTSSSKVERSAQLCPQSL